MTYSEAIKAVMDYKAVRRPSWPHYNVLMESLGSGMLIYNSVKTFDYVKPFCYIPSDEDKSATDWEVVSNT